MTVVCILGVPVQLWSKISCKKNYIANLVMENRTTWNSFKRKISFKKLNLSNSSIKIKKSFAQKTFLYIFTLKKIPILQDQVQVKVLDILDIFNKTSVLFASIMILFVFFFFKKISILVANLFIFSVFFFFPRFTFYKKISILVANILMLPVFFLQRDCDSIHDPFVVAFLCFFDNVFPKFFIYRKKEKILYKKTPFFIKQCRKTFSLSCFLLLCLCFLFFFPFL